MASSGKLISEDLGIKLENVKWAGRRAGAAPTAKRAGIPLAVSAFAKGPRRRLRLRVRAFRLASLPLGAIALLAFVAAPACRPALAPPAR
jgi:hypothetical protein